MTIKVSQTGRVSLGAIPIDPMPLPALIDRLVAWSQVRGDLPKVAFGIYAHCINLARKDPAYRSALQAADLNYVDGMGVLLALRALGVPRVSLDKATTTDIIHPLCRRFAALGIRPFLLGARPGVAEGAAQRLCFLHPGLSIAGSHHGYFPDDLSEQIIRLVNASGANVLVICLGVPREQRWAIAHREQLQVSLMLTAGGLLDFISERVRRGPAWMTDRGLEWLFRLVVEPRRLAARYLLGNPQFVMLVLAEVLRSRRQARANSSR